VKGITIPCEARLGYDALETYRIELAIADLIKDYLKSKD